MIDGGTRPNVVAERCTLEVDVRAATREGLEAVEAAIAGILVPQLVPDVTVTSSRPAPLADGEAGPVCGGSSTTRALAGELGFELRDAATGGASDANTTAGMGIPTLDGLGPIGGIDHSPQEYLEVGSIVPAHGAAGRADRRDRPRPGGRRAGGRTPGRQAPRVSRATSATRGPWEAAAGYTRAVAVGDALLRGGHDRRRAGRAIAPSRRRGGPGTRPLRDHRGRLGDAGFALADVVRTRMYVVEPRACRGRRASTARCSARPPGSHARSWSRV